MHSEALVRPVCTVTWGPWLHKLGGQDWVSLEMGVWRCTWETVIMPTWSLQLSEFGDTHGSHNGVRLVMHFEAMIKQFWRCSCRLLSSQFGCTHGGHERVYLEIHLEAIIVQTCRMYSNLCGYTLGGHDWTNIEIHSEAVIKQVWRCTPKPWLWDYKDALWGYDWVRLEDNMEAVDGSHTGCWSDSDHQLVYLQQWECDVVAVPLSSNGELAGGSQSGGEVSQKLHLHSGVTW